MDHHLTPEEARAILALSTDPNWQKFKEWIDRLYKINCIECQTTLKDHRYYQGKTVILCDLVIAETKSKNILDGK